MADYESEAQLAHRKALMDKVVQAYASGMALDKLAAIDGLPDRTTVYRWEESDPNFAAALARAKRGKAATLVQEGQDILDAPLPEGRQASAEATRARERANYRKWLAGCLDRKQWGDAVSIDAQVRTTSVVAFADLTAAQSAVAAASARRDMPALPHIVAPDGADDT